VSPYFCVTPRSPATILLYGKQDPIIPYTQGERLYTKLREEGCSVEHHVYENSSHMFTDDDAFDGLLKTVRFVARYLN